MFPQFVQGGSWKDARAVISGTDPIVKYYSNYDPNWSRKALPETTVLSGISVKPVGEIEYDPKCPLPLPGEIDPIEFYKYEGKRPAFVPYRMAQYYVALLGNLIHTEGDFWRFEKGIWKLFNRGHLMQICVRALQQQTQANWMDNTIKILSGLVNRSEDQWPKCHNYVNCLDGMVNLVTGKIEPHDPAFGSRVQVPCHYDWDAPYDQWLEFLEQIFEGDQEKIDVLQEFFGYCLTTNCRYQKAMFLYGTGANGKSTVLHVLRAMVGAENSASLEISALDDKFSIYFLQNKLVNLASETTSRAPLATEIFKKAVAGDAISAEKKYGHKYEFVPFVKFLVAMNDLPVIPDKTHGFGRKIIVLEFNRRFKPEEQDARLADKLITEKDGIFMWAILGLGRLMERGGFAPGKRVVAATDQYLKNLNPFLLWFEETYELDADAAELTEEKWGSYQEWCRSGNHRQMSRNRFYDQVLMQFPAVRKGLYGESRRVHFIGIRKKRDFGV